MSEYMNLDPNLELDWDGEVSNDGSFVLLPEGDYPYSASAAPGGWELIRTQDEPIGHLVTGSYLVETGADGARENLTALGFLPRDAERRDLAGKNAARNAGNQGAGTARFEGAVFGFEADDRITVEEAVFVGHRARIGVKTVFKVDVYLQVGRDVFLDAKTHAGAGNLAGVHFEGVFAAVARNFQALVDKTVDFDVGGLGGSGQCEKSCGGEHREFEVFHCVFLPRGCSTRLR